MEMQELAENTRPSEEQEAAKVGSKTGTVSKTTLSMPIQHGQRTISEKKTQQSRSIQTVASQIQTLSVSQYLNQ